MGDQAGRGVGLDVVKRVIEGMNGHINVESIPGIGTKFTLDLPLTLLIATALLVRAGNERYADSLAQCSRSHNANRFDDATDGRPCGVAAR